MPLPSDLDVTAANNTTIDGTDASEGCAPGGLNNIARSLAATIAAAWGGMYSGTTRPTAVQSGSFWRDTSGGDTANVVKFYDGTDDISVFSLNLTTNVASIVLTDGQVATAKIADSAVTTAKIADDAVTTAKIPDDAVTLAKQAAGTQGGLFYYAASGAPTELAAGTDGQYLKTQGSGANPTWDSPNEYAPGKSTAKTPTANTTPSHAHGLGAAPENVWGVLECTTADLGYSVGDKVILGTAADSATQGVTFYSDATNAYARIGSGGVTIMNASTGSLGVIDASDWSLYLKWTAE